MSVSLELEAGKLGTQQPTSTLSSKINDLPEELMSQIFSYLSKYDLQNLACVNRSMHSSVKAAANSNEPNSIKHFIQILSKRLKWETFPIQREKLIRIYENIASQNFINLILLKKYILDVKAELIDVLKTLDLKTVVDLGDQAQPPHFLEDIFELALFERQIDEANLIPNENERGRLLWDIFEALVQAGKIDRAIEVATSIPSLAPRGNALRNISQALAQAGNFDRAIDVVTSIPDETTRGNALRNISQALAQAGKIDRAIEVATSIPDEALRGYTLCGISKILAQTVYIDRAIQVATSISVEDWREVALRNVFEALTRTGNIGRALMFATSIPDETKRGNILQNIFEAFAKAGIDKAIEYIKP